MRKVVLFSLLMILVGSLSACTPTLSDQQIKADLEMMSEFKAATLVDDSITFTKEKNEEGVHVDVTAKWDFFKESIPYSVLTTLSLDYVWTDGKWMLGAQTYKIDQVIPTHIPKLSDIAADLQRQKIIGNYDHWKLISNTPGTDPNQFTFVIEWLIVDGPYRKSMRFTVECVFDRDKGWAYTVTDWIKQESMDWTGTYDLVFTVDEPGFPSNYLNQFYDVGDEIKGLVIQGSHSITRRMDGTKTETGTFEASFSFKGIEYHLIPVIDGLPTTLRIKLSPRANNDSEDSDLILHYRYSELGTYMLEAFCMWGEVTKLP